MWTVGLSGRGIWCRRQRLGSSPPMTTWLLLAESRRKINDRRLMGFAQLNEQKQPTNGYNNTLPQTSTTSKPTGLASPTRGCAPQLHRSGWVFCGGAPQRPHMVEDEPSPRPSMKEGRSPTAKLGRG